MGNLANSTSDNFLHWTDKAAAVFLGLAVTTVAFGRAVLGVWLTLAALIILFRFVRDRQWRQLLPDLGKSLGLAIVATFAWWLVCSILSIEPSKAMVAWARTAGLVFLGYCMIGFLARSPRLIDLFLQVVVAAAIPVMAYIASIGFIDTGFVSLMEAVFGKPLRYGTYFKSFQSVVACLLPLLIWAAWRLEGKWRWLVGLVLLLSLLVLHGGVLQLSRSAALGLVLATVILLALVSLKPMPQILRRSVVAAGVAAMLFGGFWFVERLPRPPMNDQELVGTMPLPDAHRQVIWGFAHDEIRKRPLVGTGMNSINLTQESQLRHHPYSWVTDQNGMTVRFYYDLEYLPAHPHNWVLEVAAENGLPGLVLMLAAIGLLLARLWTAAIGGNMPAWAALATVAVFFSGSLANFSFWSAWWQASFLILLSVLWAAKLVEARQKA